MTTGAVRLYSYVVARDFGFAPNPFFGFCTLATCKPEIRKRAALGDWVIGTGSGSKSRRRGNRVVFAMRVSEAITFNEYWDDPRFSSKKPYLPGSKKLAYGDNIYFKKGGIWHQENSHHSLDSGKPNKANISHDTQTDRVLIGEDFVYWGRDGPIIPPAIARKLVKRGPGHRCDFDHAFIHEVTQWLQSRGQWGYVGAPLDW
jgi:hypothetical protein